ncbi:MAG: hypothetical protein EBX52_00805 [Proteobacteria bacterium]|nr:hypothetical protein [Pseudomonadota bacterium]
MGLVFLFLKIFPAFGISLAFVFFDLARNFKRKGNKAWIGLVGLSAVMLLASVAWVVFRGDRNSDLWFSRIVEGLRIR